MRTFVTRLAVLLVLLATLTAAAFSANTPAHAQDKKVVCDADLVLNLYFAESYFSFSAVTDAIKKDAMGKDMKLVDLAKIDKGQYEPLFAAMMKGMDKDMKAGGAMMDAKMMESIVKMMMNDKMMSGGMDAMGTVLKPVVVAGEPAECSALRTELNKFFNILVEARMSMMMPAMAATPAK